MSLAYEVVGAVFALLLVLSAYAKLARLPRLVEAMTDLGVPPRVLPLLAVLEVAGAVGLLIGMWWAPLGIAAAVGLVVYFIGAVTAHVRKSDYKGIAGAAFMFVVSIVVLVLSIRVA
jgi:uncharacterized membrane protein YphA (DoxX/SURF4 family)